MLNSLLPVTLTLFVLILLPVSVCAELIKPLAVPVELPSAGGEAASDFTLAQQLGGIWRNPPGAVEFDHPALPRRATGSGFRIRIAVNGLQVEARCIGTPYINIQDPRGVYYGRCENLPFWNAVVRDGRLVGTKSNIEYGGGGSDVVGREAMNEPIKFNESGQFLLGDGQKSYSLWEKDR